MSALWSESAGEAGPDEGEETGRITATGAVLPLPGCPGQPVNPDNDGAGDDRDAKSRPDVAGAGPCFRQMDWIAANEPPIEAFDLNGNCRPDFADVVLYFNEMTWIATNQPVEAFDLNYNNRIDFADIVALFNEI